MTDSTPSPWLMGLYDKPEYPDAITTRGTEPIGFRRKPLRVLDLFAGLGGWSQAFVERGHEVVTLDMDPRFDCDIRLDILDPQAMFLIRMEEPFDVVLASPPCEAFSVAAMGHHWTGGNRAYEPATDHAKLSIRIVERTLEIIKSLKPAAWIIENPRGMMRKLPQMQRYDRVTVTYCQYGERNMKPTDLWLGGKALSLMFRPMCGNGADCHDAAPRGAKTGTQGIVGASERAKVPYLLSLEVCEGLESLVGVTS